MFNYVSRGLDRVRALLFIFLLALPLSAAAHTIRPAVVTVNFTSADDFTVTVRMSAELLLADIGSEYADTNDSPNAALYDEFRALPPEQLARLFDDFAPELLDELRMEFYGARVSLTYDRIEVAPIGDLELSRDSTIFLTGATPADADTMVWYWPEDYGSNVLRVASGDLSSAASAWLKKGQASDPYKLGSGAEQSWLSIVVNYIVIGFEHIVPKGLDHILFVVGLFLLCLKFGPLLWQVSAFTLAHTITLGLSIYGLVALPPSVVEPLIALSIAYVGIENIFTRELKPWRVVLVFLFGLLHGLGFAGVLSEIGLPESEFLTALIAFNVGVELGQLSVILGAFLLVGWFRNRPWYRQVVIIPGSLAIAVIGLYWTWERVLG